MKIIDYLYFRFYKFTLGTSLADIAEYVAFMNLTIVLYTNFIVISKNLGIIFTKFISLKTLGYSMGIVLFIIFYFIYVRNKKYLALNEKYKSESKKDKNIRTFFITIYLIFTLIGLLFFT
jgi:phosphate/sulfate permease